jgi:protein-tyrosine phosphatase
MPSVLFVCTGNQYRSPIAAAAFLRQLDQHGITDQWLVKSAGTWTTPDQPPPANAVQAARDLGLDISDHTTRMITAEELSKYDLILVMEQGHKEAITYEFSLPCRNVYLLPEVVEHIEYDISDPADPDVDVKKIARELCDLVQRGFPEICSLAGSNGSAKS